MGRQTIHQSVSSGRAALAAVLGGLAAGLVLALPAQAAGDGTARLERRVRDIEARLGEMQTLMREMRALLPGKSSKAIRPAATTTTTAARAKKPVMSGGQDVALTISGQINRGVLFADDGRGTQAYHVDNDNSSTRLRLEGTAGLSDGIGAGARIEVQFESNSTSDVNQLSSEGVGLNSFTERKIEAWFDHEALGRLTLGQGETASFGTATRDISGTRVAGYSRVEAMAGGLLFARKDIASGSGVTSVSPASPSIGQAFDALSGLGRDDRVRYDTPRWMGLSLATSHTAAGAWDVGARYAGKLGPFTLESAFSFARDPAAFNQVSGSISALHESGLNATFAASARYLTAATPLGNPDFWYLKLGYILVPFSFGATAIAVDYGRNTDILMGGDFGRAVGAFLVQNVDRAAAELYLGLRNYSYDQRGANFDDISVLLTGMRVKF